MTLFPYKYFGIVSGASANFSKEHILVSYLADFPMSSPAGRYNWIFSKVSCGKTELLVTSQYKLSSGRFGHGPFSAIFNIDCLEIAIPIIIF